MIKRIGLPFHQWEIDRQISIENVDYDEINWHNESMKEALRTEPSSVILVPNILLQKAENVYVYLLKNEQVVCHTSFGVCPRPKPEDYIYTETEHFTYTDFERRLKLLEAKSNGFSILTWHIDTDEVFGSENARLGSLGECMKPEYTGTWFYAITSTSDKGSAPYPTQYEIDGANGHLSLRDYVIWTGNRLIHIPVFEAKASTEKDPTTGKYNWTSGVDGLYPSTAAAYNYDMWCRFIAAHQKANKNSGYDCTESGLYSNVTAGRPVSVIDTNTPVGNMASILDFITGVTSQLFLGQTTETEDSLHTDLWFRGNKETTQWLRALTSDNFIRFVNMNYTGFVNWAVAPGIYKVKENSSDGDRAFEEEYTMFVIPGSPEPDAEYLAKAKEEDRVKMREHAITQIGISDITGAVRVRYCPIPKTNRSVSGYCVGWFDVIPTRTVTEDMLSKELAEKVNNGGTVEIENGDITTEKIADNAITEDKLSDELLEKINTIIETNEQILGANSALEAVLNGGDA